MYTIQALRETNTKWGREVSEGQEGISVSNYDSFTDTEAETL